MHRLLRLTITLISLLPAIVAAQGQQSSEDPGTRSRTLPDLVQVSGVVTFVEPQWRLLFVQDGVDATKVRIPDAIELPDGLAVGDQLTVEGRGSAESDFRTLSAVKLTPVGTGDLPIPVTLSSRAAATLQNENRLVEAEGVVYQAEATGDYQTLKISTQHTALKLSVGVEKTGEAVRDLLGKTVQFRGVLVLPELEGDDIRVLLPGSQLHVKHPEDGEPAGPIESSTIEEVISLGRDVEDRSTIVAQAITHSQARDFVLQDPSGRIRMKSSQLPEIQVGDIVIASGSITGGWQRLPMLTGDVVRVGPGQLPIPHRVSVDAVFDHAYQYIRTKGTFTGFAIRDDERIPVLKNKGIEFKVSGSDELMSKFDRLQGGTELSLTGVPRLRREKTYQFEFMASDIDVLYLALDNPAIGSHAQGGVQAGSAKSPAVTQLDSMRVRGGRQSFLDRNSDALFVVALLLMLAMLVAFLVLLRRTREQRKFYAAIHEQLNEVSHVSRLNTLAEMVGSLAHELNQPLASVTNFAETARILNERPGDHSSQFGTLLDRIGSESLRAGEIIRRLRTLVQRKTPGQVPTSMNQVVNDALDIFRMRELVANGTLDVQLDDDLPNVEIDPVQFQQVILNLLLNARDATTGLDGRMPKIIVRTVQDGDRLTVSVEDNGPGIASSDPQAVFEPYFTTKDDGLGLGLAISRTIVESHSGMIHAENLEPHGVRMTVSLLVESTRRIEEA